MNVALAPSPALAIWREDDQLRFKQLNVTPPIRQIALPRIPMVVVDS
jgi:hypothetical protein